MDPTRLDRDILVKLNKGDRKMNGNTTKIYQTRLEECHPNLQKIFNPFFAQGRIAIICGHRNEASQNEAYRQGKSKLVYPYSLHNRQPSLAIDVMPWYELEPHVRWDTDGNDIDSLAVEIFKEAKKLDIPIAWGGDWLDFTDKVHWELK